MFRGKKGNAIWITVSYNYKQLINPVSFKVLILCHYGTMLLRSSGGCVCMRLYVFVIFSQDKTCSLELPF